MKREYKICYSVKCPRCKNFYCTLKCEEKILLSERFNTNIYCLIVKDNKINFSFENDPQFIKYSEYLDSLKVMNKLKD